MNFNPGLHLNEIINNKCLSEIFLCSNTGGMRRSLRTNSLVLISDYTKSFYTDIYEGGILKYTGMGLRGDQKLKGNQNLTLFESATSGINVFWFEVFNKNEYTYRGVVELAYMPFQEMQNDVDGNERRVWIFPLVVVKEIVSVEESIHNMYEEMLDMSKMDSIEITTISEEEPPAVTKKIITRNNRKSHTNKRDYISDAKKNSKIGTLGEYMILNFERERLQSMGRQDLADKIEHVSCEDDSVGFDIISFDVDVNGNEVKKYIEVKTTTSNKDNIFFISQNEKLVMEELKENYWLYRVFNVESEKPKFYRLTGIEVKKHFDFIPRNYVCKLKEDEA